MKRYGAGLLLIALLAGCGKDGDIPGAVKGAVDRTETKHNLKSVGLALLGHAEALGKLPPPNTMPSARGGEMFQWRVAILPFLNEDNLFKNITQGKYGAQYWENAEVLNYCPKYYRSADDKTKTHFRVFHGNGAAFEWNKNVRITDFTDGANSTILVVEATEAVPWTSAEELFYDPKKPLPALGHSSRDGFLALLADGTVRYIPKNTDEKILRAMITRNGNEKINLPGAVD